MYQAWFHSTLNIFQNHTWCRLHINLDTLLVIGYEFYSYSRPEAHWHSLSMSCWANHCCHCGHCEGDGKKHLLTATRGRRPPTKRNNMQAAQHCRAHHWRPSECETASSPYGVERLCPQSSCNWTLLAQKLINLHWSKQTAKVLQSDRSDEPGCTPQSNGAITRPIDPGLKMESTTTHKTMQKYDSNHSVFFLQMRVAKGSSPRCCSATGHGNSHPVGWRRPALWNPQLQQCAALPVRPAKE